MTSQPIPFKISGAKIPAVPLPQATIALIFLLILFFFIKSSVYIFLKSLISFNEPLPCLNFLFNVISFNSDISSGA